MARNLHKDKGKEPELKSRLSRKIAELTMVVHLLFTRNHEREIEIEAWKTAYENEISVIQKDLNSKMGWLEGQLDDLEKFKVLFDLKNGECEKLKDQISQHQDNEKSLKCEIELKGQLLSIAQIEIVELKERLNGKLETDNEQTTALMGEIEQLKKENSDLNEKLSAKTQKIKKCQSLNKEKQKRIEELESELKETLQNKEELVKELSALQGDWQDEINQLQKTVADLLNSKEESDDLIGKLEWKNQQLTQKKQELTNQVKDLESKLQQIINDNNRQRKESRPRPIKNYSPEVPKNTPVFNKDEELERLRREIQKYRLELSNRESNFNRMFTDHQPVLLETGRGKKISTTQDNMGFPNLTGARRKSTSPHLPALEHQRSSATNYSPRQFHGF